jgi:hypothetical protein
MASGKLFPSKEILHIKIGKKKPGAITRNGGWGDLRDVLLCKSFAKNALDIDMEWLARYT